MPSVRNAALPAVCHDVSCSHNFLPLYCGVCRKQFLVGEFIKRLNYLTHSNNYHTGCIKFLHSKWRKKEIVDRMNLYGSLLQSGDGRLNILQRLIDHL